ncbi:MAG: endonuclease [Bacteroidota bacterium]
MKTTTTLVFLFIFGCWTSILTAQDDTVLFPGVSGDQLLTELQNNYTPRRVLQYGPARDVLYSVIYNVNDSVSCVYTGHTLYVDPNEDPSTFLFRNGVNNGINAEHTYPQSKGAGEEPARADMHNLFPTRVRANEVRLNFPFGEIPDDDTDFWYINSSETRTKPTSNIDGYSEFKFGTFEPREAHKGNVARAMFYFYTIYRDEALEEDPTFFSDQRQTLCNWHYLDPVDNLELVRTNQIAIFQDQKANPFVLDCTLAKRLYCQDIETSCALAVQTTELANPAQIGLRLAPNPNNGKSILQFELAQSAQVELTLINMLGQQTEVIRTSQNLSQGAYQWDINVQQKGIYTLMLKINDGTSIRMYPSRMIVN